MNDIDILTIFNSASINIVWSGIKIIFIIAFMLYVIFSIIIISQVKQMTSTINDNFGKQAILISWLHFGLSLLALVWAIVVL